MLPKKERLTRAAFNNFFAIGKKTHTPLYTLVYTPHEEFHASVVVSKKIERAAVGRNKIRRRIYAMLRAGRDRFRVHGVFIFITKKEILTATSASIREQIEFTLQKYTQ